MLFLLAALPNDTYKVLLDVFATFEGAKKSMSHSKPDCKASNFRELRNLDDGTVHTLLERVQQGTLPLNRLNQECKEIKKLNRLKAEFAKEVGASSWEEAAEKYPRFTGVDALQPFMTATRLVGPSKTAFQQFCKRAIQSSAVTAPSDHPQSQSICKEVGGNILHAIYLRSSPADVTFQEIATLLPQFGGFPLIVMRSREQEVCAYITSGGGGGVIKDLSCCLFCSRKEVHVQV